MAKGAAAAVATRVKYERNRSFRKRGRTAEDFISSGR
jgi:hypothetical protein